MRHSTADTAAYHPVLVTVKETTVTGWICLPDQGRHGNVAPGRLPTVSAAITQPSAVSPGGKARGALSLVYTSALTEPINPAGDMPCGISWKIPESW